ncbi:DUF664 domain-containing protein [Flavobacteriaceae bacterium R38]|nr:DUF664 domain-containing protein [Flavobacteriaceae bacterium R38]
MNRIISHKNYDYQIGILVCEMEISRSITYALTENLSKTDLDYNFDKHSNSIGTLLLHFAITEFKFQLNYILKRQISEEEYKKYIGGAPFMMHKRMVHGNDLEYYINDLKKIRKHTLHELKSLNDEWLFKDVATPLGENTGNHYYMLRHLIDDEIRHQGQIKLILKRLHSDKYNFN